MASMKAEKHVGTQLFGQVKKEPAVAAKTSDGAGKTTSGSKSAPKKAAPKTTTAAAPKRKAKSGKSAAKN